MSKNNPLKKFGEILRSNVEEIPFKGGEITTLSKDVRKDIVYEDGSPITHYWSYYFTNECEDLFPIYEVTDFYKFISKRSLSHSDYDKILMGEDDQFNKFYERIETLLHPIFKSDTKNGYGDWVTEIDVTPFYKT
ncbi:hypothetical protein N9M53_03400 [Alphaproteobacteria bacterium]|nr:hypothetical protein [Alphaproteobacteria bacterium]